MNNVREQEQTVELDIFFVDGLPFLIAVIDPLELTLTIAIHDKTTDTLEKGITKIDTYLKARGFTVNE